MFTVRIQLRVLQLASNIESYASCALRHALCHLTPSDDIREMTLHLLKIKQSKCKEDDTYNLLWGRTTLTYRYYDEKAPKIAREGSGTRWRLVTLFEKLRLSAVPW